MKTYNYILTLLFVLFASVLVNGQIFIGDGLTISEGSTLSIKNQDVIINTDEIKGKGKLVIQNNKTQKIKVAKALKTDIQVDVKAKKIDASNKSKQYLALNLLPPLSTEIIVAKEKERKKKEQLLPVRYVNYEGKSFKIEDEKEENSNEPEFKMGLEDFATTLVVVDMMQVKFTQFNIDYNIPIYRFLLNERFSDYAKLYEFKCLTALLKPPIA